MEKGKNNYEVLRNKWDQIITLLNGVEEKEIKKDGKTCVIMNNNKILHIALVDSVGETKRALLSISDEGGFDHDHDDIVEIMGKAITMLEAYAKAA